MLSRTLHMQETRHDGMKSCALRDISLCFVFLRIASFLLFVTHPVSHSAEYTSNMDLSSCARDHVKTKTKTAACLQKMTALSGQRWWKQNCRELCDNWYNRWSHILLCLYLETCYVCVSRFPMGSDKPISLYKDHFL